jgi:16S rRNA (guanine527-N7)-methyltransferase
MNILKEGIGKIIAPQNEEIITLLERYIKEIELFNEAYGLVGTSNRDELIKKHILDSIAPLGIISRLLAKNEAGIAAAGIATARIAAARIADAGSGAGLPGIPLAICLPECQFTLIERMGRRAGFLHNTTAVLGLSNIKVEEKELEKVDGLFNLVIFRAFKPLDTKLLKTLFKKCADGGIIAAYKGKREKIEQELQKTAKKAQFQWEIIPYNVPFLEEERHIMAVRADTGKTNNMSL